jgi:hypothetical protein
MRGQLSQENEENAKTGKEKLKKKLCEDFRVAWLRAASETSEIQTLVPLLSLAAEPVTNAYLP